MLQTIAKLVLLFFAATILHWAGLALLGGWGISLHLMLIFVIAVCSRLSPEYGYPVAFLCGLFLDFFGVKLFGHNAFVFMWCAIAVYNLEKRFDFDSVLPQIVCVFILALGAQVLNMLLLKALTEGPVWPGWGAFVGGIVLSALISPAIFWGVRKILWHKKKSY